MTDFDRIRDRLTDPRLRDVLADREAIEIGADAPLALLPVRLETRYVPGSGGAILRVRIYPDTIHVSSHEDGLTDAEVEWGRTFWRETWDAGTDGERRQLAWTKLAQRFGTTRAAYVARASAPASRTAPPVFGEPRRRADSWTQPAIAALLPDRWLVRGYQGRTAVVSAWTSPVRVPLAVGPTPNAPVGADVVDDGMRWMVDFPEAVQAGMAVEIALPAAARGRLDAVIAFGVNTALDADRGGAAMAALLDAHHFDDGLALVPQGTPTNLTDGGPRPARDAGYGDSFAVEMGAPAAGGDGDLLASALGVPSAVFGNLAHAAGSEQLDAAHMNSALFPATWGYFLAHMMGTVTRSTIDATRAHFIAHVRARGPLPVLRIGRQPLGVLPVTSLEGWQAPAGDTFTAELAPLLRRLRETWLASVAAVPAVDGSGNADQLGRALAMDANGRLYRARMLLFEDHVHHVGGLFDWGLGDRFWHELQAQARAAAAALGLPWIPRLANAVFAPQAATLIDRLVRPAGATTGDDAPLAPNYVAWLRAASVDDLQRETLAPRPDTLLYLLLRHSLLLAYADAAARGAGMVRDLEHFVAEPAIVDLLAGEPSRTGVRALAATAPGTRLTLAAHLSGLDAFEQPWQQELGQLKRSLRWLEARPAGVLAQLLRETLDLSAYRLDAWITSLATRRLAALRTRRPAGLYVGGYGWVLGLEPRTAAPAPVPPGEQAPIFRAARAPGGWVHAPSVTHATTAAVLRSTRVAHLAEADDRFAIDLSPRRARLVEWLLEGVRQGQPLGALLGYRFERGLHEGHPGVSLDRFIQPIRDLAPLVAGRIEPVTGPSEAIAARNVVDGLALQRKWAAREIDLAALGVPASGPVRDAIVAELDALTDAADAVGDALLAESVHQIVRGNPVAATGTLDALGRGDGPPPQLDVLRTPRSGMPLTHRVLVLLQDGPAPVGWSETPRRRAEPLFDRFAASLLGAPSAVRATVTIGADRVEVGLDELGLAAIDVVVMSAEAGAIERRIEDVARRRSAAAGPATIELASGAADRTGFADVLELARSLRAIATGRPLEAAHLVRPDVAVDAPAGDPLLPRAAAAVTALQAVAAALAGADRERALRDAALFGIDTTSDAARAKDDADARLGAAASVTTGRDKLAAIFGSDVVALRPFTPANAADLAATFAASHALTGGDPLAITTWLADAARVRGELAGLGDALLYADALGRDAAAALRVGQLPHTDGDRWSALVPVGAASPEGKLSLVALAPFGFDPAQPCAGVFLDEWTEVLPSATETTGLAFQFDQPGNRAPQAILLAVPPDERPRWDTASLERVLLETIDLARMRMVDNATLAALGHYAPALYFAFNPNNDTTSLDVYRLVARRGGL